jgi:polysaccharide biosynthesis/export protein
VTLGMLFLASALASTTDYRVGPGDVLRVDIYGETFGGTFVVGTNGAISMPYCELVPVGGLTVLEAEDAVEACLADGYLVDPQVSVRIEEYKSQRVEVLGAVVKPGLYYLTGETTLRSVIGQAGGVQAEKSVGRVVVTRANGDRVVIPIDEIMGPPGEVALQRGDSVNVDEGELVWVGGEVEKPGSIGYVDGMTVTQALMKAGGPTGVARLSGAYLLRDGDRISVNLRRMLRGKDADFVMEPGDRLVVQESPL